MKATYIDYQETKHFSKTVLEYLHRDPKLSPFLSYWPSFEGFEALLQKKQASIHRKILVDTLKEQYATHITFEKQGSKVQANIALLHLENTFTVTTGHQLNLFTGPFYFIFKIVSTINLSKELAEQFPERNFVPIYWMATEDHDFQEINHTYINGEKIIWKYPTHGATGQIDLAEIEKTLEVYTVKLGFSENAKKLIELIRKAYRTDSTLADATRYLVHELFKKYGLIIIDANDRNLKKAFSSIILQDIIEQNSYQSIRKSNEQLQTIGIERIIHPREINFFYLSDHLRERIIFENDHYAVLNTALRFTTQELKSTIRDYPERFSPNVVMRPLYQEYILPNVAYVGGGTEISYWLQLKGSFDHYQIPFPILILRNSALIIEEKVDASLKKLDLTILDIFGNVDAIQKTWISHHSTHPLTLEMDWQNLEAILEEIKIKLSLFDVTLGPSAESIKARLHKMIRNLEAKMIRAEKKKYADALTKIQEIHCRLFPKGELQERSENFASFYIRHGEQLIASLIEHLKPLDFKFTILQETKQSL